jgi:hypothetical protein
MQIHSFVCLFSLLVKRDWLGSGLQCVVLICGVLLLLLCNKEIFKKNKKKLKKNSKKGGPSSVREEKILPPEIIKYNYYCLLGVPCFSLLIGTSPHLLRQLRLVSLQPPTTYNMVYL